ncbi:hypothetical protein RJ639_045895 [Escallonia herrerae]|uniref:Uncharacterized protein n=1 Tax=Escallonia herrerae TaxID=1293975 RepID=A0AA89B0U4_9ASTE|nr:hypothetical protein RJ639_045895 [Escallonia herrerae]
MPCRNVLLLTSMISALDQHRRNDEVLVPFKQMVGYGVQGTPNTYSCVITACASALALGLGAGIDGHVIKLNYVTDGYVAASMITFYANASKLKILARFSMKSGWGSVLVSGSVRHACKLLEQSYFSKFTVMVTQKKRLVKFFKLKAGQMSRSLKISKPRGLMILQIYKLREPRQTI